MMDDLKKIIDELTRQRDKAKSRWVSMSWDNSFDSVRDAERNNVRMFDEQIAIVESVRSHEIRRKIEARYDDK